MRTQLPHANKLATFSAGGKVRDLVFSPDGERLRALVEDGTWSWPTSAACWLQRACTQLAWAEAHGEISRRVCMHPTL